MKGNRTELLLHEPNLYKAFLILALPVFGANFMKAFNELVDTFFIGQISNSVAAQAGVSLSWPLLNIFAALQVGFGVAGVAVISQLLGSGQRERAEEHAGVLLTLAVGLGAVLNLLLWLTAPAIMTLTGAEGEVLVCAVAYLRVRSFELTFTFIFAAFQAVRQAQGDTVTPVLLSVSAVLLNIALTGICVQVLGMGMFGAGLATTIGNMAVAPVCLVLLFSHKQSLYLTRQKMRVHGPTLRGLSKVAAPAAISQALSSLGFLVLQAVILSYGDHVTAAFSIGNKVSNILLMPVLALGSVLAAYVGQNIGANNPGRARRAYIVSRNIGLAVAVVGSLLLMPLRGGAVALLSNDTMTRIAASEYMFWVLLTQPLMSLFQNYLGVFNGSGKTKYAFIVATCRLWVVRLPLILLFRTFTTVGAGGIWYAMVISNVIILILSAILFRGVDFSPLSGIRAEEPNKECGVL